MSEGGRCCESYLASVSTAEHKAACILQQFTFLYPLTSPQQVHKILKLLDIFASSVVNASKRHYAFL